MLPKSSENPKEHSDAVRSNENREHRQKWCHRDATGTEKKPERHFEDVNKVPLFLDPFLKEHCLSV
jgi:hypothetical protein